MTKEELIRELQTVQKGRFTLAMIDRWDESEYNADNKLFKRELEIKKELEEVET